MKSEFFKKIKEYLFVRYVTDYSFKVGKLGYGWHTKNERHNSYVLLFGTWFNKWFLERIDIIIGKKDNPSNIVISGPKHIFWWYLKSPKDKNKSSIKRFHITENDHTFCG